MIRFFVDEEICSSYTLRGEDAKHLIKSLRIKIGEQIEIVDVSGFVHLCEIIGLSDIEADLKVISSDKCLSEPSINVHLFQCLPKSDKLEFIIQKTVELGVGEITPVLSSRCISRPDKKSFDGKLQRLNKISKEASQQSQRGKIPFVNSFITFQELLKTISNFDTVIVFYECADMPLKDILRRSKNENIAVIIGPEGGFDIKEIDALKEKGVWVASLGKRILRCETAPICALSAIMYETENLG